MLLDIHSHILHNVDDGAKTIEEAVSLLSIMQMQGVTDVIATPHFYPHDDTLDNFNKKTSRSFNELKDRINGRNLPNIYLGSEVLYYSGISKVSAIKNFTLNGSNYILLEPNPYLLNKTFMGELLYLRNEVGLIPIIPHIERFHKAHGFKHFVEFVKENNILTQINATSVLTKRYNRVLHKLFTENVVDFIGTDAHSVKNRPPLIKPALALISEYYGEQYRQKLTRNSENLYNLIIKKEAVTYDLKQP